MNCQPGELYQRIQAFSLDEPDARLTFSKRLARDNGWTIEYTQRVIEEYKKFVFLAVVAGHPVTPSDQVDQVWHLHLTYTQSYWGEFCPNVLPTPLHHNPTLGGRNEQNKFNNWYNKTLVSYQHFFGEPPTDIWSLPYIRFGRDIDFVRVNTQENWIVPKPQLNLSFGFHPRQVAISASFLFLALGVTGCGLPFAKVSNPLELSVPGFVSFYLSATLVGICLVAIFCLLALPFGKASKIAAPLFSLLSFFLLLLGIAKLTTGLSNLQGIEFIRLYTLTGVTALLLDVSTGLWINRKLRYGSFQRLWEDYTPSWEEFTRTSKIVEINNTMMLVAILSIFSLYFLGTVRIIIGVSRDKPVGFLLILSLLLGGYLLYSISKYSRSLAFKSLFEDWIVRLISFWVGLSLFAGVLLGFNIFSQWFPGWIVVVLFALGVILFVKCSSVGSTHQPSQGSHSNSRYSNNTGSGGGSDGSWDGSGDGGDGGDSGCGGCGGCGGCAC
jgi:hypothetical protein